MEVVTPEATEGEGKSGDAASGAGVVTPLPTATRTWRSGLAMLKEQHRKHVFRPVMAGSCTQLHVGENRAQIA